MNTYGRLGLVFHQKFDFNILPLRGKRPKLKWDKWQDKIQTEDDINEMDWTNTTGLGCIQGIDEVRILDFDGVNDYEIIELFIKDLGLEEKYPWVVQSGSGAGFHIYIKATTNNEALKKIGGEKAVYKLKMRNDGYCEHLELRWKDCQTALPKSRHESGGIYNYYYSEPKEKPNEIALNKLIDVLDKYCIIEKRENKSVRKIEHEEKIYYEKERLEAAIDYLSENLPKGSYEDWYRIGFALVPLGKDGEEYFIKLSMGNPNYNDNKKNLKEKFSKLVNDYDGSITLGTVYHIAEILGWKKPIVKFWYVEDNGRIKISRTRFKRFLEGEGYCKYKMDSNYIFIRIDNNIVEEIDSVHIKEYVMTYLKKTPIEEFGNINRNDIIDALIKSAAQLFTTQFFEFLITREIVFNKDTPNISYLYYQNNYVEITKNNSIKRNYVELNKAIWKKQILDRNFERSEKRTDFEDFLYNICRNDSKRYTALKSTIGYLLHQYKNPSSAKAIIYIDEKLSEGSYGRSGKGLVIKAMGHLRNIVVEDGRNFNPSKNFAFQRIKIDTDIIALEDIREKFPFERLFAIITDGIVIEQKNKDEIFIPFNKSPKIVISTNFSVKGIDDSTLDRQFLIEFSDYYNKNHRPIDDFGKLFFESWEEEEWNSFDNFMVECLQLYLDKGLVEYEFVNIETKKMIDETCPEFAEFTDILSTDKIYDKKELHSMFKEEYEDYEKLTQGKFTRWLKIWARINGYNILEKKSGSNRTITFSKKNKAA